MKPYKDYVHQRRAGDDRRIILELTDEDVVSGIIAMVVLGIILGAMIGFAI